MVAFSFLHLFSNHLLTLAALLSVLINFVIVSLRLTPELTVSISDVQDKRQTALFSATQTKKVGIWHQTLRYPTYHRPVVSLNKQHVLQVEDLARLSFQTKPIYIDVDEDRKKANI